MRFFLCVNVRIKSIDLMKEFNKLVTRVRLKLSCEADLFLSCTIFSHALDFSYLHPNWMFSFRLELNAIHRYRLSNAFELSLNVVLSVFE